MEGSVSMLHASMFERIATDFVAFFIAINPLSLVPLFIGITKHATRRERRAIAVRGVIVSAVVLLLFIVAGQLILNAMGISVAAFRIAGGLVLLVISMQMVLADDSGGVTTSGQDAARPAQDVAVFPLAVPFIADPGTIIAAVVLADAETFSPAEQAVTAGALMAVLALTLGVLLVADRLQRVLKETGTNVLNRVLGLLFAAVSVQIILDGIGGHFSLR
ncbi:MAG: MarC family protein [bacterium]